MTLDPIKDRNRQALGTRVTQARCRMNLQRNELAVQVQVSSATMYAIENGLKDPNVHTLRRLCQALELSADYLLAEPP